MMGRCEVLLPNGLDRLSEKNLMLNFRLRGIPKVENRVDYDYALIFMRTSCGFGTACASKKCL